MHRDVFSVTGLTDFVVFDLETTGLNARESEIIEIGAIKYMGGKPESSLNRLIKPQNGVPAAITKLTGISDKMLADKPSIATVLPDFADFAGDLPLIAHNVHFDLGFIETSAALLAMDNDYARYRKRGEYQYFTNDYFDTVELARIFNPVLNAFNLKSVTQYYGVPLDKGHRALDDAKATAAIFEHLLLEALGAGEVVLAEMLELLRPTEDMLCRLLEILVRAYNAQTAEVLALQPGTLMNYSMNHFNIIGELRSEEFSEETAAIEVDEIDDFVRPDGKLASGFRNYELREGQQQMMYAVTSNFNNQQFLIAEAGTGTGKSLAYLIPAIFYTADGGQRVVISTNTKNLQEQLFYKDIPHLAALHPKPFSSVLLKGKNNYLCLDRMQVNLKDRQYRLTNYERKSVLPLLTWRNITQTGDIAENNGFQVERNFSTWAKFIAENNYCPGRKCRLYHDCYLMKARNAARKAEVVVVNHSLVFSDLISENSVLGEYDHIVFDEAHHIEKTATDFLGFEFNFWNIRRILHKLYKKDSRETGLVAQTRSKLVKSDLHADSKADIADVLDEMNIAVQQAEADLQNLFAGLTSDIRSLLEKQNYGTYQYKQRFLPDGPLHAIIKEPLSGFKSVLHNLQRLCDLLADKLGKIDKEVIPGLEQLQQETSATFMDYFALQEVIDFFVNPPDNEQVLWIEMPSKPDGVDIVLRSAPLEVASSLKALLFDQLKTAIFTSATLAVDGQFDYFARRIGIDAVGKNRLNSARIESPFSYEGQAAVFVPAWMPDPRQPHYANALCEFIRDLAAAGVRNTMILFTSYALLNSVYETLRFHFEADNRLMLGQGKDGSRNAIIERFRNTRGALLLGTDSFWEGVDLPGEALELLVMTKLPFEVPTDPVVQARMQVIEQQGGNSFFDYSVPEAIIKFRQGFGRLIRSASDSGAVFITDTRVITKAYGRRFLNALPLQAQVLSNKGQFDAAYNDWLARAAQK
jgi:predicted DnaQ family exonuclease/DinG family helicase